MPRSLVDPRFPGRLRQLRETRCLSLRQLAAAAYISKSTLSEMENGRTAPSVDTAECLDRALDGGGELAAMVTTAPAPDPDQMQRVQFVIHRPTSLDAAAVDALAGVLIAHRHLDDVLDSRALLPIADVEWRTITQLAHQARGHAVGDLRRVAAIWTQFYGWLLAEADMHAAAVRMLTEAAEQADAIDDGILAAQVSNFRGYVERRRGNPRGIVRHFLAAFHTPGATLLQRVGDAAQAAQGYGLLGDRAEAIRLLSEASDLTDQAAGEPAPESAYWLTPEFCRMNIGLAYLALGDHSHAADNLRAGLASLPAGMAEAEWATEYRTALADAVR